MNLASATRPVSTIMTAAQTTMLCVIQEVQDRIAVSKQYCDLAIHSVLNRS